ncbi:MAG TPA: D-alanyl-D-alanine carboxypeptidase [Clostridiales bacterium]|nr:D-alanyl-D-alanine carboxypeptidase [Clostridiales bacterium]
MKKAHRIISIVLAFTMVSAAALSCPVTVCALAGEEITAPSSVLIEADSGKLLFDKNCHEVRACASITKVMTLLLVFEAIDSGKLHMDDMITASAHAASMGGSDIWLEEGEAMTVDNMIKATVVASANDAAVALAETVSGSEDAFVAEMNAKAKELGMNETTFKNCNGLDEDGHLTSAYDVALMSRELIKHKQIFNYTSIWMDNLRDGKTQIVNTNKLLKSYSGITGLKTGTTGQAGSCISATANRDGLSLIAVVLGCTTGKDRFSDAAKVLDYGFANFAVYVPKLSDGIQPVKVVEGMDTQVQGTADLNSCFVVEKGRNNQVKENINLIDEITAPVEKGDKLGTIEYTMENEVLAEYPIVAENSVEEMSFSSVFALLFGYFVNL